MFFLYLTAWYILSMNISPEITFAGVLISCFVYKFACDHMRHKPMADLKIIKNIFLGIKYALTLVKETAKANIAVFRIVFKREINVEPRLVYFRTGLKTNNARVALANSITLTPGTIVVSLNEDLYCVHSLNKEFAEGIDDSIFVRQLKKLEE